MSTGYPDISDLSGCLEGSSCFVVGSGPSLIDQDISQIHQFPVFTVNAGILLMDWIDMGNPSNRYWLSNDSMCMVWDYFWDKVCRSRCRRVVRTSWLQFRDQFERYGFRYFEPRKTEPDQPLDEDDPGLSWISSIPTALDLAIKTGCKRIFLLGMDHKLRDGKSHFWQFLPEEQHPKLRRSRSLYTPDVKEVTKFYDMNIPCFEQIKAFGEKKGVSIYNCTPDSAIKVFDYMDLENALSDLVQEEVSCDAAKS